MSERWVSNLKSIHEKIIFPNYIELAKNHEELGEFLGPKNPLTKKNLLWTLLPIAEENESVQIEKTHQVYLGEKGERISAIRNTVIHDAENLGLVPLLEPNSDKDSTMQQELANCHAVYDISTYKKRRVCVTIKKYTVSKPPYIQIRLYISYFLYIFKYHYFEISASDQWALSLKSKIYSWKKYLSQLYWTC